MPYTSWTCVQTERTEPCIWQSRLPSILIGTQLVRPETFLSEPLTDQLELWQHDGQYVRFGRMLKHLIDTDQPLTVLVKRQKFRLIGGGYELVYRAHKGWIRIDADSPLAERLPPYYWAMLEESHWLWFKRRDLLLFSEPRGDAFYVRKALRR